MRPVLGVACRWTPPSTRPPFLTWSPRRYPAWVCRSPNGGLHIDHRLGRIDIDVAKAPTADMEINWTGDYGVRVLSRAWLSEIEDLIDERAVFVGDVRRKGRPMEKWATSTKRARRGCSAAKAGPIPAPYAAASTACSEADGSSPIQASGVDRSSSAAKASSCGRTWRSVGTSAPRREASSRVSSGFWPTRLRSSPGPPG